MMEKYFSKSGLIISYLLCFSLLLFTSCGSSKKAVSRSGKPSREVARTRESAKPRETAIPREEARKEASKQEQVIKAARSYMGTPYKWGGTSRSGMDCSGLLVSSFREAKIELPRTSEDQSRYGKQVSIYELQPGDLVFFSAKKGRGKISHVGMVTEVKSRSEVKFIHASSSLGVVESNLHSDYYRNIFVKAQRPF